MSDASISARPSLQATDGASRPERPPRRISRVYSDMGDMKDDEGSQASSSLLSRQDVRNRAAQSRIERLVKDNTTSEKDIDRTPTRNARTAQILAERASRTALRRDLLKEVDEANERQSSRKISTGNGNDPAENIRSTAPHLRHYTSTATIRSSERNYDGDAIASSSTSRSKVEEQLSPRSERLKRSQKYEEDIQRMRSESRLGEVDDQKEMRERRSFSRSSQKATDNTDTSGTEGSGPVIGNRRRKKSSTGSSSKKAAARAAQARDYYSSPSRKYSPRKDRVPSSSDGPTSSNGPYATLTSPLRTESAIDFASPSRGTSSRRMPLPSEFQSPRYRAEAVGDTSLERERLRRNSIDAAAQHRLWSRGDSMSRGNQLDRREERLQRLTALSPNSDAAIEILKSPIGTASTVVEDGRVLNGIGRTLSRQSSRIGKYGALTERDGIARSEQADRSISDFQRQRKISTSSSVSQRSSSVTSELHRASSRGSLRRNQGRDVFDDGSAPPVPDLSKHPLSPLYRTFDLPQEQRSQTGSERQPTIKGENWRKEVEELQTRIDQLTVAANTSTSRRDSHSRSSSRASASAPRSSTSNVSSTPSASFNRRPNRPSTEPRNVRNGNDHTRAAVPPLPAQRYESLSRASIREAERRLPVTPIMTDMRAFSGSRMGSGAQSSNGRFSSMGRDASRSLSASTGSGPLHERNLLNSVEAFERYLIDTRINAEGSQSSPHMNAVTDTTDMVKHFRETSDATIKINAGLRQILQGILECQIDAEVQHGGEKDNVALLHDIDKSLSTILRDSDEQMRNLTDGLLAFTRAEKERDRFRRANSDLSRSTSTLPRSSSRLASLGLLQMSPERERKMGRDTSHALYNDRRPSTDLRKSITLRDRDRDRDRNHDRERDRIVASNSNSSIQAVESRSQASDHSSGSRNSADSSSHHPRRHTLLHASRESSSIGSSKSPSIPYSPSPNPSAIISGTGIHPRIRGSNTSPTLDMHMHRRASAMDRDINHSRSASEVQIKNHTTHLTGLESLIQRSPLLRRDKSSTTSVQTIRAPISLSPKRDQLSFPIVSAMNVEASTANDSMMDHGEGFSTSPTQSNDDNGAESPEGSVD